MGRPFEADGTRIRVRLGGQERRLLARLLDEVGELLDDGRRPEENQDPLAALVGFDLDLDLPDDLRASLEDSAARSGDDSRREPQGAPDAAAPEGPGVAGPPDPALARLLPDAHREDPAAAAEFRRLTETGLRSRKRRNLSLASTALQRRGHVVLTVEEANALLKGLTDVRLVLGERLGLSTDEDADAIGEALRHAPDVENPWVSAALLYDVLTWWQEALVAALVG